MVDQKASPAVGPVLAVREAHAADAAGNETCRNDQGLDVGRPR